MTRALTWILSATLAAACGGQEPQVEYATSVNVADPDVVAIGPDVDVVVGAREPVFRTNNAYWLYRGDRWYRSDALRGDWLQIATPPPTLTAIVDPDRFANYRADRTVYRQDVTPRQQPSQQPQELQDPWPTPSRSLPEPQAPYPRPPQQEPPVQPGDPSNDRVPDPTMPSPPGPLLQR